MNNNKHKWTPQLGLYDHMFLVTYYHYHIIIDLVISGAHTFLCWHQKCVLILLCTEWRPLLHSSPQAAAAETGFYSIAVRPFVNEQQQHAHEAKTPGNLRLE